MDLDSDYKRDRGSGSGQETAYAVEARYNAASPVSIGEQIFDNRWREVVFPKGPIGVPGRPWNEQSMKLRLLGYSQAQALRWWLHAEADSTMSGICLETRLIKYEVSHSHKAVAVSQHCIVGGEDRSNFVPDYGIKSST